MTASPSAGTVRGRVILERRASSAGATVEVDGRVETTNSNGDYLLTGLVVGAHTITIRHQGYLRTSRSLIVSPGQDQSLPDVTLLAGDLNQDGRIEVADGLIICNAWNATAGGPLWDPRADINDDWAINILDLVAVQFNWDRAAPGPWPGE